MKAARAWNFPGATIPILHMSSVPAAAASQDRSAIRANLLAHRQSRHPGAATGMHDGFFQGVIVIQAVRQCSISKHGIGSSNLAVTTDQSAVR
jgi:hypothetical protein